MSQAVIEGKSDGWLPGSWWWLNDPVLGWLPVEFISQQQQQQQQQAPPPADAALAASTSPSSPPPPASGAGGSGPGAAQTVITLQSVEKQQYQITLAQMRTLSPCLTSSSFAVDDLILLPELHEGAILNTLRQRYKQDLIYTNISSIVLSVNPYKLLPCYGPATIAFYRKVLGANSTVRAANDGSRGAPQPSAKSSDVSNVLAEEDAKAGQQPQQPGDQQQPNASGSSGVPPHVYALADAAYTSLLRDGSNQAVLISGESGAGKTEATKLVLQYLAEMSGGGSDVEQQLLSSNPIIEAFGNSKTVRNNNSSRFGRWIEVHFDSSNRIRAARMDSYLLEKTRVVNHAPNERSYHVFYALLKGATAEERAQLQLSDDATQYKLLNKGNCVTIDGVNDKADWAELRNSLHSLQFSAQDQTNILKLLAAILHLGNLDFEPDTADTGATTTATAAGGASTAERYRVSTPDILALVSNLLSLDASACARALISRQLRIGGGGTNASSIQVFNSLTQCRDNRDSLCKFIYETLFISLIQRINHTLSAAASSPAVGAPASLSIPLSPSAHSAAHIPTKRFIGVLDVFGFENFDSGNAWEQFCINYANEKLNEHFIHSVFRLEQDLYKSEGIHLSGAEDLTPPDHTGCVALIEERRAGIIDRIVEAIRMPKESDVTLLERMHEAYAPANQPGSAAMSPAALAGPGPKPPSSYYIRPKTRELNFGIRHFAAPVTYSVESFLEKNRDAVPEDVLGVVDRSSNDFIARLSGIKREGMASYAARHSHAGSLILASSPRSPAPGGAPSLLSPSVVAAAAAGGAEESLSPPTPQAPSVVAKKYNSLTSPPAPLAPPSPSAAASPSASATSSSAAVTVGAQFRSQLSGLLQTLSDCRPNFIRCLKPNAEKVADHFDAGFMLTQLRYLGIRQVIQIRASGFAYRMKRREFWKRYRMIVGQHGGATLAQDASDEQLKEHCVAIFNSLPPTRTPVTADYKVGHTQIFYRSALHQALEAARDRTFLAHILRLQGWYRGCLAKRRFAGLKSAWSGVRNSMRKLHDAVTAQGSSAAASPASQFYASVVAPLLTEFDLAYTAASDQASPALPPILLASLAVFRGSLEAHFQCRVNLERTLAPTASKDEALLNSAINKADEHLKNASALVAGKNPAKSRESFAAAFHSECVGACPNYPLPELPLARAFLSRLVAYHSALNAAVESRSLEQLKALLQGEARDMGLNTALEQSAQRLVERLEEEGRILKLLGELIDGRGPLEALKEAVAQAEALGFSAAGSSASSSSSTSSEPSSTVARAQQLLAQLQKETSALRDLQLAIDSRSLALLDSALGAISAEESLSQSPAIVGHPLLAQAQQLKLSLKRTAEAQDLVRNIRAATTGGGNIAYIESQLEQLKALGEEALASLGAEGENIVAETQSLLELLRRKAALGQALQAALDARHLADMEARVAEAQEQGWGQEDPRLPQLAAVQKMVSNFHKAIQQLTTLASEGSSSQETAAPSAVVDIPSCLLALQTALDEASRLGLSSSHGAFLAAASRRESLQRMEDARAELGVALQSNDETALGAALSRAEAAHLYPNDPRLQASKEALASLVQTREKAQRERESALAAAEQERILKLEAERAAEEAARRAAQEQEAAAAAAAAEKEQAAKAASSAASSSASSASGASGNSLAPLSRAASRSVATRPSGSDLDAFRSRAFALPLFPGLRSPEEYGAKLFGSSRELKATMLSWSKECIPKSLTKYEPPPKNKQQSAALSSTPGVVPLTGDEFQSESLSLFKSLQGYMGDRNYSFPDSLGCEVLRRGWERAELRDEILCQVAKQIQHNNGNESVTKGWQMMALCAETFPPSPAFRPFLLNFLLTFHDVSGYHAAPYVEFCLRTLQQRQGQRQGQDLAAKAASEPPSIDHVAAFRDRVLTSAEIIIALPDGSRLPLHVDPSMNAHSCVMAVQERLGLSLKKTGYGLFHCQQMETSNPADALTAQDGAGGANSSPDASSSAASILLPAEPQPLSKSDCPLDYAAAKSKDSGYVFLFQKRVLTQNMETEIGKVGAAPSPTAAAAAAADSATADRMLTMAEVDPISLNLLYHQLLRDILQYDHYGVTRDELVEIVAYKLLVQEQKVFPVLGDAREDDVTCDSQLSRWRAITPLQLSLYPTAEVDRFWDAVTALCGDLRSQASASSSGAGSTAGAGSKAGVAISQWPLHFVQRFCKTHASLGYQAFLVENSEFPSLPHWLFVGVSLAGVFLLDSQRANASSAYTGSQPSLTALKHFKYPHITGWASNAVKFSLRVLIAKGRTQQVNFQTKQGKAITSAIQEFVDWIVQSKKPATSPPAPTASTSK